METGIAAFSNQFNNFQHSLLLQMAPRYFSKSKKIRVFFFSKSQKGKGYSLERTKPISYLSHIIISHIPHFSSNHLQHKRPRFKYPKPNPPTPQGGQWWDWELCWEVEKGISVDNGKMWDVSVTFLGYFLCTKTIF